MKFEGQNYVFKAILHSLSRHLFLSLDNNLTTQGIYLSMLQLLERIFFPAAAFIID